jgi:glutathione synthase
MKICFVMYPWEKIQAEFDTTLRMIHEAVSRGHLVAITSANNLTIRNNVTSAFCKVISKQAKVTANIISFHRHAEFKKALLPLAGFDAIIMRSEPPLDSIAINFLDSVRDDTFIMNDIHGLRVANNKLYTASFGAAISDYLPATYVSKNKEYLEHVLYDSPADKMILKPLNGFGGRGVILVEKSASQSFKSLLDFYIENGKESHYVILQEYIEGADQGDVRILVLNGEPIGAMRRIPASNDMRSNIHAGGSVVKHLLTRDEINLCKQMAPKLVRDGLFFVGLDVINGKLIEVNVLSPGGIARINKLNRVRLQEQVVDFIESIVNAKDMIATRKTEFRKVIDDADFLSE